MNSIIKTINAFMALCLLMFVSCKQNDRSVKPMMDGNKHIGDSIFIGTMLSKVEFTDSNYYIDSIVYVRDQSYKNSLKAINTYMKGRRVFENMFFYPTGQLKTYLFVDDHNEHYFYRRTYSREGKLIQEDGKMFFQGYLDKIDPQTLEVKADGKRMKISIFYPRPPDCKSYLFVNLDTIEAKVFTPDKFIPFLQKVWVDVNKNQYTWSEVDIWLREIDSQGDTLSYHRPLFYKPV